MIKWTIDKKSKVPRYLQLKDSIKQNISLGVIKDNQQLPGVMELGEILEINFETVRKAYKELENEGLVSMERGKGTIVTLKRIVEPGAISDLDQKAGPEKVMKSAIEGLLRTGMSIGEAKQIAYRAFNEVEKKGFKQTVIFTECNHLQLDDVSKTLEDYLGREVTPVFVRDLKDTVEEIFEEKGELLSVVTTGFHINEVNDILSQIPVYIHTLIIGMTSQTREALRQFEEKSCIGFICGREESLPLYEELLHEELGAEINLSSTVIDEEAKVEDVLKSADVVLAPPEVYEDIKKKAPSGLPVFNLHDNIDPMSLKLLKDKIIEMM